MPEPVRKGFTDAYKSITRDELRVAENRTVRLPDAEADADGMSRIVI